MKQIKQIAVAVAMLGTSIGAHAEAMYDSAAELASIEAASRSAAQTASIEMLAAAFNSGRVAFDLPSGLVESTNIWAWQNSGFTQTTSEKSVFVSVSEGKSGMRYATFVALQHDQQAGKWSREILRSGLVCDGTVDAPYESVADICLDPSTVPSLHWSAR